MTEKKEDETKKPSGSPEEKKFPFKDAKEFHPSVLFYLTARAILNISKLLRIPCLMVITVITMDTLTWGQRMELYDLSNIISLNTIIHNHHIPLLSQALGNTLKERT